MKRLLVAVALFVSASGMAGAQELRFLNGFDTRYPPTKIVVQQYAETVERATGGKVKFRHSGPEVVNAFQQFEPVSKGAFDLLFTVQPYHVGTTAVSLGIYTLKPDPVAFRKTGIFEELDKEYQRFNLKLLSIIPGSDKDTGAFHAAMREPVGSSGGIAGRRVRGNPFFKPFIDSLGSSMVVLQVGEVYSALQRGTIDGAFGPISGSMDYKWHEAGKYSLRPSFAHIYQFLLINKSSFDRLSPDVQKVLVDEGEKIEVPGMRAMTDALLQEDAQLKSRGMLTTELAPAQFQNAMQGLSDGIWETVETSKASGDRGKAFRAFVRQTGLAGIAPR